MIIDMDKLKGRAKGGAARQAALTPEQRSENARKAALAKTELARLPRATHSGVLKIGDAEIPCAVLPDGRRVLSQRGVMSAIGRKYGSKDFQLAAELGEEFGGGNFPVYLAVSSLKPFIDANLGAVASSPIKYIDKASKTERKAKLHQWLTNDIGHPKLREHLASIVTLLKISKTPDQFKQLVDQVHPPLNTTIPLDFGNPDA